MNADVQFAWIPPGNFLMGGNGQDDNPQRRVTISQGFWMGVFLVTQSQWEAVMGYNPSFFAGPNHPVETVSWDECQEFCRKLGELTGKPIRLPTEAEWEYVARAGTDTEFWSGNGEEALNKVGWYKGNSKKRTHSVGEKAAPNPWGLHDVHGNVNEWCQDWHGAIVGENRTDPEGPSVGECRVVRGGCWGYSPDDCGVAARYSHEPDDGLQVFGFRVCFNQE
jgi:formylglycine-generating enzyme required for sulfatase activity